MSPRRWILDTLSGLWRSIPFPLQRRILLSSHDHFLVGVVGLIRDSNDRLLLLEHRFRNPWRWGLPGGFVRRGEGLPEALMRELREEVELDIEVDPEPFDTELNQKTWALTVTFTATCTEETPKLVPGREIVNGGFYSPREAPRNVFPYHRQIMARYWQQGLAPASDK